MTKVAYEWCIEETNKHDDIVNSSFADKLSAFNKEELSSLNGNNFCLALVRDSSDNLETEGVQERGYAYLKLNGGTLVLPDEFDNGYKVPKKFHAELKRSHNASS